MKVANYDRIGKNYNLTRKADPYLAKRLHHFLRTQPTEKYLDIGCGTGNYTVALHDIGIRFIGVDPSMQMLQKAKANNPNIQWVQAKAEDLPFENESFDGAMVTLTIHHWSDLGNAFDEIARVLRPKGRLVIFTSTPHQMKGYWLNHYFPNMLNDSMVQMPSLERVGESLTKAGFAIAVLEKYFIREGHEDLFLYAGKHEPALYLDERVRQGISSFSSLANREEVANGLRYLKEDIASGFIREIIKEYENEEGDYIFLVAVKAG